MVNSAAEPVIVDLLAEDFHEHAHEIYDRLRAESPVCRAKVPAFDSGFWMVTGRAAAEAALRDPRLVNDSRSALTAEEIAQRPEMQLSDAQRNMLVSDPPVHTRLRRIVLQAFTPRMVSALQPVIVEHTERLLTEAEHRAEADGGVVDLLETFAYPFPLAVLGDMLGYPRAWHAGLRELAISAATAANALAPPDPELQTRLEAYAHDLIELKLREPADDLVSRLVHPESEADELSRSELVAMIGLLTAAGFETTAGVISSGLVALLRHPEQWSALCADPSLAGPAVEEILRFWGPAESTMMRLASEPLELAGQRIERGDTVVVFLAAANRDPGHVDDPHRFDIHRRSRGHLGFGGGIHTCLGAALARAEGRIALTAVARRWPEVELAEPDEVSWRPGLTLRGLRRLRVRPGHQGR